MIKPSEGFCDECGNYVLFDCDDNTFTCWGCGDIAIVTITLKTKETE